MVEKVVKCVKVRMREKLVEPERKPIEQLRAHHSDSETPKSSPQKVDLVISDQQRFILG